MNDVRVGLLSAVVPPIDVETGAVQMGKGRREAQALRSGGRNETVEGCHTIVIERIQGPPSRILIEVGGFNARCHKPVGRLVVKKHGDQVELLVHKAQSVEDHCLDGMTHGDKPGLWVVLGGLVNDVGNPEFIEHPGHEPEMVQDLTIWLWHRWLLRREESANMPKLLKDLRGGAESRVEIPATDCEKLH
jgi:hypothetical protein